MRKLIAKSSTPSCHKSVHLRLRKCGSSQAIRLVRCQKSHLLQLPTELVLKIIGMVPLWHHNRMRGVCRQLRLLTNLNVMHEVQRRLVGSKVCSSYESAVQEVDCLYYKYFFYFSFSP